MLLECALANTPDPLWLMSLVLRLKKKHLSQEGGEACFLKNNINHPPRERAEGPRVNKGQQNHVFVYPLYKYQSQQTQSV